MTASFFGSDVRRLAVLLLLAAAPAFGLDRSAITFTRYDLRATVVPTQSAIDITGEITIRNDSTQPQSNVVLQISSSLAWQRISIGDQDPSWLTHPYQSDIDHTGALTEAVVTLPNPLQPKETLKLSVHYGGTITRDSTRLTRIGTPKETALRSDWDQISPTFSAIRGMGYVTWYPVSMEAVSLSKGDEVFDALAAWKEREADSNLNVEFHAIGDSPGQWVSNSGVESSPTAGGGAFRTTFLLSSTPTLVFGQLQLLKRPDLTLQVTSQHTSVARDYAIAAEKAQATLAGWFGAPKRKAVIIELEDPDALPFQDGAYLFTPIKETPPLALEVALARVMAHADFDSPRIWVREGLANFAQVLVREQQQGRKAGLAYLNQFVTALSAAESQARGATGGGDSSSKSQLPGIGPQPLIKTHDELFFRTKSAFVWWMLRDMLGDDGLKTFLSRYRPENDKTADYVQRTLENAGSSHRDLEPFFDSWVYRDNGLPELTISAAYGRELLKPKDESKSNYVVTLTIENTSLVWVEVPLVVRAGRDERSIRVVAPPHSKAVARAPFPGVPEEAIVNDGSVPEADVSDNRIAVQVNPAESLRK